jgi:hypothetical protein
MGHPGPPQTPGWWKSGGRVGRTRSSRSRIRFRENAPHLRPKKPLRSPSQSQRRHRRDRAASTRLHRTRRRLEIVGRRSASTPAAAPQRRLRHDLAGAGRAARRVQPSLDQASSPVPSASSPHTRRSARPLQLRHSRHQASADGRELPLPLRGRPAAPASLPRDRTRVPLGLRRRGRRRLARLTRVSGATLPAGVGSVGTPGRSRADSRRALRLRSPDRDPGGRRRDRSGLRRPTRQARSSSPTTRDESGLVGATHTG